MCNAQIAANDGLKRLGSDYVILLTDELPSPNINRTELDYRWLPTNVLNEPWGTIGYYELVSQNWRGHSWTHHLVIVRPASIRNPDITFLEIAGDGNGENHINSLKTLAERRNEKVLYTAHRDYQAISRKQVQDLFS